MRRAWLLAGMVVIGHQYRRSSVSLTLNADDMTSTWTNQFFVI